jgi:hypothetical protein
MSMLSLPFSSPDLKSLCRRKQVNRERPAGRERLRRVDTTSKSRFLLTGDQALVKTAFQGASEQVEVSKRARLEPWRRPSKISAGLGALPG